MSGGQTKTGMGPGMDGLLNNMLKQIGLGSFVHESLRAQLGFY